MEEMFLVTAVRTQAARIVWSSSIFFTTKDKIINNVQHRHTCALPGM